MQTAAQQTRFSPRSWHKKLAGALLALLLLWCLLLLMAPGMIRQSAQSWAQSVGRRLDIGSIKIHPLSMAVEVSAIRLADRDGSLLLKLDRATLRPAPAALLIGRWRAYAISLDGPQLNLARDSAGTWNWGRFVQDASKKTAAPSSPGTMPRLEIDAFSLTAGQLHVRDELGNPGQEIIIKPVDLALKDISTLPVAGGIHLQAGLDGGGQLDWSGQLQLQPLQSSGKVAVRDLPLASVWPYIHPLLRLPAPAGTLNLASGYRFDLKGANVRLNLDAFMLQLNALRLHDPVHHQAAALNLLKIEGGTLDWQKHAVTIHDIALSDGDAELLRQSNGQLNWAAALPRTQQASPAPTAPAAGWKVDIQQIRASNLQARLSDHTFLRPLSMKVDIARASSALQLEGSKGLSLNKTSLELASLAVGEIGKTPKVTLQHASLADSEIRLLQRKIQLGALQLDGLKAQVERQPDGRVDLLQLLRTVPSDSSRAPAPAWNINVPEIQLRHGQLRFRDQGTQPAVALMLDDLTTTLRRAEPDSLEVKAQGRVQSGRIDLLAQMNSVSHALKGQINLQHLPLVPVAPYVLGHTALQLKQGQLSAALDLVLLANGQWHTTGQGALTGLAVFEPGQAEPLLAVDRLSLQGIRGGSQPAAWRVRDVRLQHPVARMVLDTQRQLNLVRLFSRPTAGSTAQEQKTSPMPSIDIRRIHVQGGNIAFADMGMTPAFASNMHNLRGSIDGISSRPGRRGSITLDGDVDAHGDVRVRGALSPFAAADNSDIALRFRDIPLSSLNPYAMNLAGWKVTDGSLGVDLNYHLQQRMLTGENRVIINSIQLGEEVSAPGVSHLPLRLAVALLEDSDHRIDLQLPVSGNLDDPKFAYGHLVWQALVNVVKKVATAPFRALGALLGSEGFDAIHFVPGEASVTPPEREKLRQLAQMMAKRPRIALDLAGSYDATQDRRELARARVDLAILTLARRAPLAGEPLATPDWQDLRIQAAVKQVFASRRGRLRLLGYALSPSAPTGAALARALREEMIAAEPVGSADLSKLAQARADAASHALLAADSALQSRIHVRAVQSVRGDQDGVALQLSLEGK
jgi:uncharacterized protein involved in outer membrane biogenesis